MKKKIISIITTLALALGMMPLSTSSNEPVNNTFNYGNFRVNYAEQNSWGSGKTVNVTITNTSNL